MSKKVYGRNHTGQNSHKAWEPYKWKWQLHIHFVETENNILGWPFTIVITVNLFMTILILLEIILANVPIVLPLYLNKYYTSQWPDEFQS